MELTPQVLREVEFREKLRGYHPDDVDDFLEEAAVAVEGLLVRLHSAEQAKPSTTEQPSSRGSGAVDVTRFESPRAPEEEPAPKVDEARLAEKTPPVTAPIGPSGGGVSEQTLSRTLLLAQQTADAVVADAHAEAERVLAGAHSQAERIVAEAETQATTLRTEAEARAEQSIAELEEQRAGLEHEVVSLRSWAMQQRDRLREGLTEQVRSLDIWLATSAQSAKPVSPSPVPASPPASGSPPPIPAEARSEPAPPETAPPKPAPSDSIERTGLVDHEAEPGWLDRQSEGAGGVRPDESERSGGPKADERDRGESERGRGGFFNRH
ncbi:MAG: hypothetical protein NVS3B12_28540 [Acidimicrobiales bacterium]